MDSTYIFESYVLQRIKYINTQITEHLKCKDAWLINDPDERKAKFVFNETDWWSRFYSLSMSRDHLYIIFTAWNNPLENEYLKKLKEKEEEEKKAAEAERKKREKIESNRNKKGS